MLAQKAARAGELDRLAQDSGGAVGATGLEMIRLVCKFQKCGLPTATLILANERWSLTRGGHAGDLQERLVRE